MKNRLIFIEDGKLIQYDLVGSMSISQLVSSLAFYESAEDVIHPDGSITFKSGKYRVSYKVLHQVEFLCRLGFLPPAAEGAPPAVRIIGGADTPPNGYFNAVVNFEEPQGANFILVLVTELGQQPRTTIPFIAAFDDEETKILPLPNIFSDGKICTGSSIGYTGNITTDMELVLQNLREAPPNNDLYDEERATRIGCAKFDGQLNATLDFGDYIGVSNSFIADAVLHRKAGLNANE